VLLLIPTSCANDHDHHTQDLPARRDAADSAGSSDLVRTQPFFAASDNKPLLDGYTYPASTDSDLDQDLDPISDSERISASHLSALLGTDVAQFFPSPIPSVFLLSDDVSLQIRRFPSEAGMKSLETALASASGVSGAIVAVAAALPSDPAERSALVAGVTERVGKEGGFAKQSSVLSSLLEAATATNAVGAENTGSGKKVVLEEKEQEEKKTAGNDDSAAGVNRGQAVAALFIAATVSGFIGWLW
jgi:hypothetical protein